MEDLVDARYTLTAEVVHCSNCGAQTTLNAYVTADLCAFCASPLVVDHQIKHIVKPHGLIPFFIDEKEAFPLFTRWAGGLWFAPNDFKRIFKHRNTRLKGVYIPFWSYDTQVTSAYEGSRGTYYYVTKTRRGANGKTEQYKERRTQWHDAEGTVYNKFVAIIVSASTSLSTTFSTKLGPWDLAYLKPFDDQYLSGFIAETFTVDHVQGLATAKSIMEKAIRRDLENDIGGDEQKVDFIDSVYNDIKLKYILLPVWLSAYTYQGKNYQILINAFTGKVYGERPYSIWKIVCTVIVVCILIYGIILLARG